MILTTVLQWSIFDCAKEWPWRPKFIARDCTNVQNVFKINSVLFNLIYRTWFIVIKVIINILKTYNVHSKKLVVRQMFFFLTRHPCSWYDLIHPSVYLPSKWHVNIYGLTVNETKASISHWLQIFDFLTLVARTITRRVTTILF
jgi:hypothetical protein